MRKPALIVIDMENDFLKTWLHASREGLVRSMQELLALVRGFGHPVVWVKQVFEPDLSDAFAEMRQKGIRVTIRGTAGAKIVPQLHVGPLDAIVIKKRYSAFFGTGFDQLLGELAVDTLILAGVNTHACIRMTAVDTYQRDWPVILAGDCIGSYDQEHHDISLRYMKDKIARVMTNAEIAAALRKTVVAEGAANGAAGGSSSE